MSHPRSLISKKEINIEWHNFIKSFLLNGLNGKKNNISVEFFKQVNLIGKLEQ